MPKEKTTTKRCMQVMLNDMRILSEGPQIIDNSFFNNREINFFTFNLNHLIKN